MKVMRILIAALVCTGFVAAQSTETNGNSSSSSSNDPGPEPVALMKQPTDDKHYYEDHHILGVVPNYATVNEPEREYQFTPLTVGEKFITASHDSFDPFNWVMPALYAAVYQKENEYSGFGQGAAGFGKRYGALFADATISTYISEAIMPVMLHEDPRYFRLGEGSKWRRIGYGLTRVLVTKTDAGTWRFNNSEIWGNLVAAGISNLYYPQANRTVGTTFEKFGVGVVSDACFNVLKEFWPDMKHRVLHR